jgi:tryptophan synthase alpha chain
MSRVRLEKMFAECERQGRPAFLPFMTAGLPDPDNSVEMFLAMESADGYEVGIPYSDPLMDGKTIQEAGRRSLGAGTTFAIGLEIVREVAEKSDKPVLVMTYANVVFQVGPERFASLVSDAKASGVIIADLPLEEAFEVKTAIEASGLGMVLFAAPTTDEDRLKKIGSADPVFVYAVAEMGVTGERERSGGRALGLAERLRAVTDRPLVFGIGISTPDQAKALAPYADGVIVGSALVRLVLEAETPKAASEALAAASEALARSLERPR